MLPDQWLINQRVRKLREKFPTQPRGAFIKLAEDLFGTSDLDRTQLGKLVQTLADATEWPTIDLGGSSEDEDFDLSLLTDRPDATPDWLLAGLSMLLQVQPGSSVLDLFCGNGTLALALPPAIYYEGHDIDPALTLQGRAVFRQHQFYTSNLINWFSQEPNSQYNMVFLHPPIGQAQVQAPCLETQRGPTVDVSLASVEFGAKCCAPGGLLVAVLDRSVQITNELQQWLTRHGTILMELLVEDYLVLIYRHRVRTKNHVPISEVFHEAQTFTDFCMLTETPWRVSVASEDPRPLSLKDWGISIEPNLATPDQYQGTGEVILYKRKHDVGIRWPSITEAFEWAMHQAQWAPNEESWDKTLAKYGKRLVIDSYLDTRQTSTLNDILNLPENYRVREDEALKRFMDKRQRSLERTRLAYPEKSTLENRYYTLGPGARLIRGDETWKVTFSEPDFSGKKPPRVHLELEV